MTPTPNPSAQGGGQPTDFVQLRGPTREISRRRAIRRFKWSILGALIVLLVGVLLPVLFLQLYFSVHQWTVYLGSWWEGGYVGLELFRGGLTRPRFRGAA